MLVKVEFSLKTVELGLCLKAGIRNVEMEMEMENEERGILKTGSL